MKLRLNKDIDIQVAFPDCRSLVGKEQNVAEKIITDEWPNCLQTLAIGYNGYICWEFHNKRGKITLFINEDNIVVDAFCFELHYEPACY